MIELTSDQKHAIESILDWYRSKKSQFITLGGFAGTGKTTLIAHLREKLKGEKVKKVAFCAYTGKAARVLELKLKELKALGPKDSVSTIHSLIYTALMNDNHEILGWDKKEKVSADLIIIDEASMVNKEIWGDLLSYKIPVLAVGDHGQLPPIHGEFNLMQKPIFTLEKIHRQAENNPIIHLSILAREEGHIPHGKYGKGVAKLNRFDPDTGNDIEDMLMSFDDDMMVLCGYNKTRLALNKKIRSNLGYEGQGLEAGERVICLKNDHVVKLVNGMLGWVKKIYDDGKYHYYAEIELEGEEETYRGHILKMQIDSPNPIQKVNGLHPTKFGGRFDRGYALTVHKAQGSQAQKVILFEERFPKMSDDEWKRWLYTGITRAINELYIIG